MMSSSLFTSDDTLIVVVRRFCEFLLFADFIGRSAVSSNSIHSNRPEIFPQVFVRYRGSIHLYLSFLIFLLLIHIISMIPLVSLSRAIMEMQLETHSQNRR